jgi:hypothetical protein
MEQWKADRYAYIVRESMKWYNLGNTRTMTSRLNTRGLSGQECAWLNELAKETGLTSFSGHDKDGPFSGYRVSNFEEKTMEAYVLPKEVKALKDELYDCQAELIQEKEYVRVLTELVYKIGKIDEKETHGPILQNEPVL